MELGFELNTTIFVASEVPESLKVLMEMMEGMVSDGTPVSFVFGDHSRYIVMLFQGFHQHSPAILDTVLYPKKNNRES